jgi:hypothetical protein
MEPNPQFFGCRTYKNSSPTSATSPSSSPPFLGLIVASAFTSPSLIEPDEAEVIRRGIRRPSADTSASPTSTQEYSSTIFYRTTSCIILVLGLPATPAFTSNWTKPPSIFIKTTSKNIFLRSVAGAGSHTYPPTSGISKDARFPHLSSIEF